jgi:hypothetical protein
MLAAKLSLNIADLHWGLSYAGFVSLRYTFSAGARMQSASTILIIRIVQ